MGTWIPFLLTYLLGGLTFVPLVLALIFAHAYLTLPRRPDVSKVSAHGRGNPGDLQASGHPEAANCSPDDIIQSGDDLAGLVAERRAGRDEGKTRSTHEADVAAGYFAVCREYAHMGINAKPIERSTPIGSATVAAPSPSVYQTMYRSIFDRKLSTGPLDEKSNVSQRPKKAGNVFYVVLRHGHLMLFDDDEQLEVRHVISLAYHDVSIYSGGEPIPEGELYIKRNAIRLWRNFNGKELSPDGTVSKPFYLFSENCSAKEDFYFALLRNQGQNSDAETDGGHDGGSPVCPKPILFDVKNIISLVERLHSSEEHIPTRWFNAMLGRIFLGVHRTADVENFLREKLIKKISRVKKPSFLSSISIRNIDTGDAAPYLAAFRLRELTVDGECIVEADVRYTGCFRIEIATTARLDLGPRWGREVDLVLAVVIRRLEGRLLLKIKPPPSNRVWFSFQTMPKMEMTIEPVVSSRQITYTVILRQIENRIKEVMAESVVLPFWDDLAFFPTEHKRWRGGIWEGDDAVASDSTARAAFNDVIGATTAPADSWSDISSVSAQASTAQGSYEGGSSPSIASGAHTGTAEKSDKTVSMPNVDTAVSASAPNSGLLTRAIGGMMTSKSSAKSPGVMSPLQSGMALSIPASESLILSPSSEVYTPDIQSPQRPPGAYLQSHSSHPPPAQSPPSSPSRPLPTLYHHSDEGKSNESLPNAEACPADQTGNDASLHQRRNQESLPSSRSSSIRSQTGSINRNMFRRDSATSTALNATIVPPASNGDGGPAGAKRGTLAAVTSAAAQARQWGWTALQKHKESQAARDAARAISSTGGTANAPASTSASPQSFGPNQPMGRGMPLPPPGEPLPMPERATRRLLPPLPGPRLRPSSSVPKVREQRQDGPATAAPRLAVDVKSEDAPRLSRDSRSYSSTNPPPLPNRRLAEHARNGFEDDSSSMLVVAAPHDSQPASPARDTASDRREPAVSAESAEATDPAETADLAEATDPAEVADPAVAVEVGGIETTMDKDDGANGATPPAEEGGDEEDLDKYISKVDDGHLGNASTSDST